MHTLHDALTLAQPDEHLALVYIHPDGHAQRITRADFAHHARTMAQALQDKGIQAGDLLIIAHTHTLESIYAFWGALLVGAVPSMFPTLTEKLDPDVYRQSMAQLTRLSHARAVLTSDAFAPTLLDVVACDVWASSETIPTSEAPFICPAPAPDSVAFLQHSSGTTGLQKGVALTHQAVLNHIRHYSQALSLNPQADVIVSWLPLYHDMGLIAGFLMPLIMGVPLVLMSPFDWVKRPAMLLRAITDYRATLCWLPNFAYNHCTRRIRKGDLEGIDLRTLRAFINCSEPVRHDSHRAFVERFAPYGVHEGMLAVSYAMAENVFAVTQTPIGTPAPTLTLHQDALESEGRVLPAHPDDPHARVHVSCGAPIDGVQVRVVDATGADIGEGRVGEVAIASDSLLTAYYRRPDLTPVVAGWYRTGDKGFLYAGEIYIIGREKDLIINAGKNVYPQDIEAIVNGVAGVHAGRVVAFGVPDEREGTELIAVVAEVSAPPDEHHAIKQAIRARVAQQSTVTLSYVHLVDERWLIKTSSGKIARHANRDKWLREQA